MKTSALRPVLASVGAVLVCMLMLLLAPSSRAMTCLQGTVSLAMSQDGVEQSYCNSTLCDVTFALTYNASAVETDGPWPLAVQFADGSLASDLFPGGGFDDVTFQCSALGSIVATSTAGPGGEQIQFTWNYATVDSSDCAAMLQSVDLSVNLTVFEVILSHSGSVSGTDALVTLTDESQYSIAALEVACQSDVETTATTGTSATATTETTGTSTTTETTGNSTTTETTATATAETTGTTANASTSDSVQTQDHIKKQRNAWRIVGIVMIVMVGVCAIIVALMGIWLIIDLFQHRHGKTFWSAAREHIAMQGDDQEGFEE